MVKIPELSLKCFVVYLYKVQSIAYRQQRVTEESGVLSPLCLCLCVSNRKQAMEMELAKCKIDIMSLNSQLLDAIQQKLNLSQQLEAWQVGQRSKAKGPLGCNAEQKQLKTKLN